MTTDKRRADEQRRMTMDRRQHDDPKYEGHERRLKNDGEWGVPVHDDRRLFEFLVLEGTQAGLSWKPSSRSEETIEEPSIDCFRYEEVAKLA